MRVYQFENFEAFYRSLQAAAEEKIVVDVHTPIHHEEVDRILSVRSGPVNFGYYAGGFLGLLSGAFITMAPNLIFFPINVGGRPLFSWPTFAIIMFELMVLLAALGAIIGFFFSQRFPRYDREIFELEAFQKKEKGEYFLVTTKDLQAMPATHSYQLP